MARFTAREWKNCATCEFWVGPRGFSELHTAAEVDVMAEGVCALNQKRLRRFATGSCIDWQRWEPLAASGVRGAV